MGYSYKALNCATDGRHRFICVACIARDLKTVLSGKGQISTYAPVLMSVIEELHAKIEKLEGDVEAQKRINREICKSYTVEEGKRLIDME